MADQNPSQLREKLRHWHSEMYRSAKAMRGVKQFEDIAAGNEELADVLSETIDALAERDEQLDILESELVSCSEAIDVASKKIDQLALDRRVLASCVQGLDIALRQNIEGGPHELVAGNERELADRVMAGPVPEGHKEPTP